HIQRLMVLSNYANLVEVSQQALNQWFNEMYIDSSEWVVAANVLGMGLHADGGKMATKPYIASGAYLDKMSDYCDHCQYQVTLKTGEKACPFNSLYWHYIASKKSQLEKNPRMGMNVKVFEKMPKDQQAALLTEAKKHLASPK
ncbi:MAG: cryptochrome/photolyase family protein, partial [Bacilli bacterium]